MPVVDLTQNTKSDNNFILMILAGLRVLALVQQLLLTGEHGQQSRREHGRGRIRHIPWLEDKATLPTAQALPF